MAAVASVGASRQHSDTARTPGLVVAHRQIIARLWRGIAPPKARNISVSGKIRMERPIEVRVQARAQAHTLSAGYCHCLGCPLARQVRAWEGGMRWCGGGGSGHGSSGACVWGSCEQCAGGVGLARACSSESRGERIACRSTRSYFAPRQHQVCTRMVVLPFHLEASAQPGQGANWARWFSRSRVVQRVRWAV